MDANYSQITEQQGIIDSLAAFCVPTKKAASTETALFMHSTFYRLIAVGSSQAACRKHAQPYHAVCQASI